MRLHLGFFTAEETVTEEPDEAMETEEELPDEPPFEKTEETGEFLDDAESNEASEEDPEEEALEEGEVTADRDSSRKVKPPLFGVEKAKADVEEAKRALEKEKEKRSELENVSDEELMAWAKTKLKAQYDLSSGANNPMVFGYIRILYPYLVKKAEEDIEFRKAVLAPDKDFAGLYTHLYEVFKARAKEQFDAMPDDEKKKLRASGGAMCYASADDTELYGPAEEYFRVSEAQKKLTEARKRLEEAEKSAAGKTKKPAKKTEKKKPEKRKEEAGVSLFEVMSL